jgi:hypothetical protein
MEEEHIVKTENPEVQGSLLDLESRKHHLLRCPSCDHFIKADDINIQKLVAKCTHCSHVFSFGSSNVPRELSGYSRPEMLIPDGLETLKLQNELDVQVDWFRSVPRSSFVFTLIFTLIWNLVLLPVVLTALLTGTYIVLLFTSVHLLVGLGMLFHLIGIFTNTTHVNVSRRYLEIRTSPLPALFRRNKKIPVENIDQLYVTRYVASRTNGNPNFAYALYAILKNGKKLKLVKGMNEETQKYLEYEIESFLGIKDRVIRE